jgi:aspartyl-tRNA(Asn)/glutamyl-tRNA(Gln) amidotransferase subunit A
MHNKTIAKLTHALATKQITAIELTQYFLDRIAKIDPKLNSFITITPEKALKEAALADKKIRNGTATLLTGIPIAHKDNWQTRGIKTTCASKLLAKFTPKKDATLVTALKKAGAVLVGKTNMDEFAMGSSSETSYFGRVKNPWDLMRVAGGSSGGSAAAVATRLVPLATGTDTGGSTRQPASLCGICGFKPTFGKISLDGVFPLAPSIDHAGFFTTCVEDLAILFDVLGNSSNYHLQLQQPLNGLKIGIPKEYFSSELEGPVATALNEAIRLFKNCGAKIVNVTLPKLHLAVPTYCVLADVEAAATFEQLLDSKLALQSNNASSALGDEVKRRIIAGIFLREKINLTNYVLHAQKARQLISEDFERVFCRVDMLIGPTTLGTAFKAHEKTSNPIKMYLSDQYTVAPSLAGLPAISIPAGFAKGLPIGMQLIGPRFAEKTVLQLAYHYQCHTNWHQQSPSM